MKKIGFTLQVFGLIILFPLYLVQQLNYPLQKAEEKEAAPVLLQESGKRSRISIEKISYDDARLLACEETQRPFVCLMDRTRGR